MDLTEYVHAVILGVVQGIAEFLPISSSGHLVIADALLNDFSGNSVPKESGTMTIALHFGTLLSILVVYFQSLWKLRTDFRVQLAVVVATLPVGVIGLLFKDVVQDHFMTPLVAGFALLLTAVFLFVGRRLQKSESTMEQPGFGAAFAIGVFQAIAIVPGISRSGSTIAAGLACGLTREAAARFSFLMAIPAIGGASVLELKDVLGSESAGGSTFGPLLLGTVVAFVVGLLSLNFLLRMVTQDKLHVFSIYCIVAGGVTILWQLFSV